MKILSEKDFNIKASLKEIIKQLSNFYQGIKKELNYSQMNDLEKIQNNLQMFLKNSEKKIKTKEKNEKN